MNFDGWLVTATSWSEQDCYEAGAQSKQAKIDLLEKELTETQDFLNKQNHIKQAKIDCMKVDLDGANERAMMVLNHKNVMVDKMQAKIDELQKLRSLDEMEINQLAQANQVWQIKCDELQARVGEALRFYNEAKSPHNIGMIQMAIYLKGNKDEN